MIEVQFWFQNWVCGRHYYYQIYSWRKLLKCKCEYCNLLIQNLQVVYSSRSAMLAGTILISKLSWWTVILWLLSDQGSCSDIVVAYQLLFFTYYYRHALKARDNSHKILINLQPWTTLRSYPRQEFQTRHRLIATLTWLFKCCLALSPRRLSYSICCSASCFWKGLPCWRKDTIFFCLA